MGSVLSAQPLSSHQENTGFNVQNLALNLEKADKPLAPTEQNGSQISEPTKLRADTQKAIGESLERPEGSPPVLGRTDANDNPIRVESY